MCVPIVLNIPIISKLSLRFLILANAGHIKHTRNSTHGRRERSAARDRIEELPTDSDDEGERHVVRQVEAVTALRFVPACHATIFEKKPIF
jgi:hypothetical protein